ncbi:uncharacterized protein LOC131936166 [Physella acuta]|uniref:uncharacterized protein LOC131936166 n=1 Tax=Physella acuta TaxID=109671 RepID=UPI0027DD8A40|nr:uncharacterized protein LOC131936166 [Physella acuta]
MAITASITIVAISSLLMSCVSVNGMALPSDDGYINLANPPVDEPCVDCDYYGVPFKCEYVECAQIEGCVIPKGECCPRCERVGKYCEVDGIVIPMYEYAAFPNYTVCLCENAGDTEDNAILSAYCFLNEPLNRVTYEEYNWFEHVPDSDTCGTVDGYSVKIMGETLSFPDGRQCWCEFAFDGYVLECSPPTKSLIKSNLETLLTTPAGKPAEIVLDTPSETLSKTPTETETPLKTTSATPQDSTKMVLEST